MAAGWAGATPGPSRRWGWPLLALILGTFMAMLDSTIVNVAVPTMIAQFGSTPDQVQWVVTAFLLVLGVVVPVSGWLGDRFGLTRVYIASLVVFTAGSALCGLSPSLPVLIGFRVLQGVGGGLMAPLTMAMVYRLVPRDRIGTAMGLYGITFAAGPAIGPTIGGYLVQFVDWRAIFFINVPVGIVTIALALAVLPAFPAEPGRRLDVWGFAASACGLTLLLLALSQGPTWGWGSEAEVLLLVGSVWLLAIFVLIELRVPDPLLDLRLFRYSVFTLSITVVMIAVMSLYAADFFVPLFMQTIQGQGAFPTGLTLLPSGLVMALFMPLAGRVYDAIGARWPVTCGMLGLATATLLLNRLEFLTPDTSIAVWMTVRNVALGVAWMPAATAGLSVVPVREISRASAINNIATRVAGALGLASLTSVFTAGVAQRTTALAAQLTPFNHPLQAVLHLAAAGAGQSFQPLAAQPRSVAGAQVAFHLIAMRSFAGAIHQVFTDTMLLSLLGVPLALLLRERRHRARGGEPGHGPDPAAGVGA